MVCQSLSIFMVNFCSLEKGLIDVAQSTDMSFKQKHNNLHFCSIYPPLWICAQYLPAIKLSNSLSVSQFPAAVFISQTSASPSRILQ